jgi:hypothetical protein
MTQEQFVKYIKPQLELKGIELEMLNRKNTPDKEGGYFSESLKKLVVAMKHEEAFGLLIHEFSHFEQWVNKPSFWAKLTEGHSRFFNWLDTMNPITRKIIKCKEDAIELEHNCEVGAVKLIEELGLDIDKKRYIQKANAYLLSYHLIATYHKWPAGKVYSDEISVYMPTKLMSLSRIKKGSLLKGEVLELMTKAFKKV